MPIIMLGFTSRTEISCHSPRWQLSSKLPDQPWTPGWPSSELFSAHLSYATAKAPLSLNFWVWKPSEQKKLHHAVNKWWREREATFSSTVPVEPTWVVTPLCQYCSGRKRNVVPLLVTLISWQHLGISAEKVVLVKNTIPS